jgi:hypothetical protein
MTEEIVKSVLANTESFDAFCALRDTENAIKGRIVRDFGYSISAKLPGDFKMTSSPKGTCERFDGFRFITPELEAHNLMAVVSFDFKQYGSCFIGFELLDQSLKFPEQSQERLHKRFRDLFGNALSGGPWPTWIYWAQYQDWGDDTLRLIVNKDPGFEEQFVSIVCDLLEVTNAFVRDMAE